MTVKTGNKVKVEYVGKLDDGSVFDSSEDHGKPLEFEVGSGHVIKGFDDAVLGMSEGDEKEFTIQPAEAYGQHDPTLVQKVPREVFPQEAELTAGLLFEAGLPTGEKVPAMITAVDEGIVTVDLNHPLAGKTLSFKIKLKEVSV
ncbi:FKBP-type peptidyl-prolyl cis-trans isomerase SlyD [Candidatus Nitrosotalea sp. TS]|uniref:FKBP-type peptidyl-prolyl cis-trans isomerase n=1 Tax=Candidatus Nitrosotalea sp. TS TaxID=2341020 RepID=UPI0014095592|nr:peptidylprolyl isomerase [Candidatus Nitrosotalea sp. TS]MDE1826250.1 peptidylprolyl isomerase [Nitrososphaerota archaeon]MDE1871881.1 peptidylprolyl isomerase [Nitrososphaerota archaeon]NHI03857.1 FKBP-type peptidyl-prolyl cis-trans isomerase SlyD [Candidatus Nitrosotalea sp. TS]